MLSPSLGRLEPVDEADLEQARAASDPLSGAAVNSNPSMHGHPRLDFFIRDGGVVFAGRHLIVDLWGASKLDVVAHVEAALIRAAKSAGATVLGSDFHHFQPNGGVTGVVVLAESHISIHTWPEADFAAVDVFMCGDAQPEQTVPVLREAFAPSRVSVQELRRGVTRAPLDEPSSER